MAYFFRVCDLVLSSGSKKKKEIRDYFILLGELVAIAGPMVSA
jgi:hypothetical protein